MRWFWRKKKALAPVVEPAPSLPAFRYLGEDATVCFGLTFPPGVAVVVTDPKVIRKLDGNRFFERV